MTQGPRPIATDLFAQRFSAVQTPGRTFEDVLRAREIAAFLRFDDPGAPVDEYVFRRGHDLRSRAQRALDRLASRT